MLKIVAVLGLGLATVGTLAQGQFVFGNRLTADGIDAPVCDVDGLTRLAGDAFLAQAYVGPTPDSLTPVGSPLPFRTGAAAGYITATVLTVPGAPGGTTVQVQMRVWESAKGATFEAARAAGGKYGWLNIVPVTLSEPPATPNSMKGLSGVCLIPEPSSLALLTLGAAALIWRRR